MKNKRIHFGCVADDFTGASDAASFLAENGVATLLFNGIPDNSEELEQVDAVIIALKCRSQKTNHAVAEVIAAFEFLRKCGAAQLYYKYCSTFDSTETGNIGPVLDAVVEKFDLRFTLLCPSLPINQRVVKDGILYVEGRPLAETHMRNHPLTPMRQSRVKTLMERQSRYPVIEISTEQLRSPEELKIVVQKLEQDHMHFYLVPDYVNQKHGSKIIDIFGDLPLLSGGSGLMEPIAAALADKNKLSGMKEIKQKNQCFDQAILLAGSCSSMTLTQIADFKKKGGLTYQLQPLKLIEGTQTLIDVEKFLTANKNSPVLVYSSAAPDEVTRVKTELKEDVPKLLEKMMAEIASSSLKTGRRKIIVAGGETSGAVTKKLGFSAYQIGRSVAPGVPIMIPLQNKRVKLILKSGNFGQKDFFWRALEES